LGEPISSFQPLLSGSEAGCEWMLTRPGITMKPRPSISRSAVPVYGPPTWVSASPEKATSPLA
jgi:hypothetical protein